jgi:PhzF family phenazine biosynthesis protein
MGLAIFQVDAFTDKPFAGNPAAVCILPEPREARWMQSVAAEMNLSETAFLLKETDGFNLRWFTPTTEVDLCGHATLASAHVLWEAGYLKPDQQARFWTRSGLLTAEREGDWMELDFPAEPENPATSPSGLARALGVAPRYVGKNRFDYLVEMDSEETVRNVKPDFGLLAEIPARGVIVTSRAITPGFDFVSRFFAPRAGINEDPVTGSAHCCLGPFWSTRLGKSEFLAYQASARGGVVRVRMGGQRVHLGGQAVTVLRGELTGWRGIGRGDNSTWRQRTY